MDFSFFDTSSARPFDGMDKSPVALNEEGDRNELIASSRLEMNIQLQENKDKWQSTDEIGKKGIEKRSVTIKAPGVLLNSSVRKVDVP